MWLFFICFLFLRLTAMGLRMVTRKLRSKLFPRFSSTSLLHSHATSFGLSFSLSLSYIFMWCVCLIVLFRKQIYGSRILFSLNEMDFFRIVRWPYSWILPSNAEKIVLLLELTFLFELFIVKCLCWLELGMKTMRLKSRRLVFN